MMSAFEILQSIKQEGGKKFTTFVISYTIKKRLGLRRSVTFNQGNKTRFGTLKGLVAGGGGGGEIWKFVGPSGTIVATPPFN